MESADSDCVFVANNVALDFVNTQIAKRGELVDLLEDRADLARWALAAGRELRGTPSDAELKAAKGLRTALGDLFRAAIAHSDELASRQRKRAVTIVNQHLANHAQHERLQLTPQDDFELVPDRSATSLSALLAGLAYEGAQLLASSQALHVKRCSNPECVLLFLDTSRSRKRRWCSMDACGNRAKVARHYRNRS